MRLLNSMRAYGALGVCVVIMLLCAAPHLYAIILLDTVLRVDRAEHRRRVASWQIFWGALLGMAVFLIMGITVDMALPSSASLKRDVPFVVVSNHPSGPLDGPLLLIMLMRLGRFDSRSVVKREVASVPVIGRSCAEIECAFLARGGQKDADLAEIAKCARVACHDRASVIIFPEGTRFRGPKAGSGLMRVLPPKSSGLQVLLAALPQYSVLSVTIGWNRDIRNGETVASSLGAYAGAGVRVHAEVLEGLRPQDAEAWLKDEWRRKDDSLSKTG